MKNKRTGQLMDEPEVLLGLDMIVIIPKAFLDDGDWAELISSS